MAEPKPFTDEEMEKIRGFCDDGLCPQCENDHRFLATIAARDERIEELRNTRLGRVCPTCAKQTVNPMKWCDHLVAEENERQTATIERLRGALEGMAQKEERIEEGTRKYIACGVCHRPIGRNTLFKNECPSDCLGNIARQAIGKEK